MIILFMIINASAEIIGSGKLLNIAFGLECKTGIVLGLFIVMIYTFLGGYLAVSWSNLIQGSIIFVALILVPLVALGHIESSAWLGEHLLKENPEFFSLEKRRVFQRGYFPCGGSNYSNLKKEVGKMVTRKRAFVFLVLVAFCSMLLCSSGAFAEPFGEPVVVGSIWSQVGVAAPLGQAGLRGSQLAVKVINQEGGIFGHPLVLKNIDGQSDTTVISNASLRLVKEEEVLVGCGLTDDSLVSAAGPIFQANETVFLVGTATTPTIPRIGDYIFMVAFGDNYQGRAVAKYCADVLGWKKVAVFWDNASAYSEDLTRFFMEAFQEYTGDENAVVHQEIYQTGDVNFTAQITRLKMKIAKEKIDGLVITPPFPQDGPIIAKQADKLGVRLPMVFTDGADDEVLVEVGGDTVEGTIISTHFAPENPITDNGKYFVEAYKAEYGGAEPGSFECLGYDAIRMMAEAIRSLGEEKWNAMNLAERRTALRDVIKDMKFSSTTMPISYPDPETVEFPRVPYKPVVFLVVRDGRRVFKDLIMPEDL